MKKIVITLGIGLTMALGSCTKKALCDGLWFQLDEIKKDKEDLNSRIANDPTTYSDIVSQNWDGTFNYEVKPLYQDSLTWYDSEIANMEQKLSENNCN